MIMNPIIRYQWKYKSSYYFIKFFVAYCYTDLYGQNIMLPGNLGDKTKTTEHLSLGYGNLDPLASEKENTIR
jgi:hypothetical protein